MYVLRPVSLRIHGYPGTSFVDQISLKARAVPASTSRALRLKANATMHSSILVFLILLLQHPKHRDYTMCHHVSFLLGHMYIRNADNSVWPDLTVGYRHE